MPGQNACLTHSEHSVFYNGSIKFKNSQRRRGKRHFVAAVPDRGIVSKVLHAVAGVYPGSS